MQPPLKGRQLMAVRLHIEHIAPSYASESEFSHQITRNFSFTFEGIPRRKPTYDLESCGRVFFAESASPTRFVIEISGLHIVAPPGAHVKHISKFSSVAMYNVRVHFFIGRHHSYLETNVSFKLITTHLYHFPPNQIRVLQQQRRRCSHCHHPSPPVR